MVQPLGLCLCLSQTVFYLAGVCGHLSHEPQCGRSCCGDKDKRKEDPCHDVSCPCLTKCVLPGAIQPKPPQLFVQYLVQILGGWENQNRANIASEKEQLEPADNVEHHFRGAKLGLGTET